ncbi:Dynein heavy chain, cytoplasmic [Trichinella britovi]|uniref:Alpha-galactosidase n=1 Tax=Trichinella britovi TaxID=45882 RepID=A0A0V1DD02_TRIBR|nr:Dynein heavy chain, cytoplasmic [Trichinella britovi]
MVDNINEAIVDVSSPAVEIAQVELAEARVFSSFVRRIILLLLEDASGEPCGDAYASALDECLNRTDTVEVFRRFIADAQAPALLIERSCERDSEETADATEITEVVNYTVSTEVHFSSPKTNGLILIKRGAVLEADKPLIQQLLLFILADASPYETLHSYFSTTICPYFKSFVKESGGGDNYRDTDKAALSVEKKLIELEMGLLHLQQNIDIPDITLLIHPVVQSVIKQAAEENRRAKVSDFGKLVDDSTFLNQLQNGVTRWVREMQKVTKLDRDPSSGSALQEITFWRNLERAVFNLLEKRESPEVILTLEVLKHGKRFHATVSFDTDTGLKQALDTVTNYNVLMKDFPINDLLSAVEMDRIRAAVASIFIHLRKIRTSRYPIQRCLRLIEAISRDLQIQMLKALLRDLLKKKREEQLKLIWRIVPAHKKLQFRLEEIRRFRRHHEQLQAVIVRVFRLTSTLHGNENEHTFDESPRMYDAADTSVVEEVNVAYDFVKDIDCLDLSKEGSDSWSRIATRLRDQLGSAKNANEMFRIFSQFNALFVRPHIRGAIREYQTQLIERVKDDIEALHERFKKQYSHSKACSTSSIYDIPPVSGFVIWAKQIERQLALYLRRVEDVLGKGWEKHIEGQALKTDGDIFRAKLNTQPVFDEWVTKVQTRNLGLSGRVFVVESVRNFKNLSFRVPLAIVNKAHQVNQLYPFAMSMIESVRTYELMTERLNEKENVAILLAGLVKEIHAQIAEGAGLVWESYKLDSYVQKFSEMIAHFQERVEELLHLEEQIKIQLNLLDTCQYAAPAFQQILSNIQKSVDALSLYQYSNVDIWIKRLDEEIEQKLAIRLEEGIKSWIRALKGEIDEESSSSEDLSAQSKFKVGGDPVIHVEIERSSALTKYRSLLAKLPHGIKYIEKAYAAIENLKLEVKNYVNEWLRYQALWDLQADTLYDRLNTDLSKWMKTLQELKEARSTFDTSETRKQFGVIVVDFARVQSKVSLKYDSWHKEILQRFGTILGNEMQTLYTVVNKARTHLEQQSVDISSTSEAVSFITYVQNLKRNVLDWNDKVEVNTLQAKIRQEATAVETRSADVVTDWNSNKPIKGDQLPDVALQTLVVYEGKLSRLKEERDNISRAREALELQETSHTSVHGERLKAAIEELNDLKQVWQALNPLYNELAEIKERLWLSVQPRKLRQNVDSLLNQMKEMPANYRNYDAYDHLKRVLQGYAKIWACDLQRYESSIKEIILVAQGELALEEFLKQLREFWQTYELELINYQNKTKLIRGWDDLFNKLKEHINSLNAMKLSPYYKEFEEDCLVWEEKLNRITALFDVWIDVQRRWVYLEGIFSGSADIKTLLPTETSKFQSISSEFLGIMKKVSMSARVTEILNIPGIQRLLERLADMLNKIQKALGEYLERERSEFPRFYFVGDEDLLEIIGNSKNIPRLQKHFKKMFAGVACILFNEDYTVIHGVASREGEEVNFLRSISIKETPRVNEWLGLVEKEIQNTLAQLLVTCLQEFQKFKVHPIDADSYYNWLDKFPLQVITLTAQIAWSEDVELVLGKNANLEPILKFVENTLNLLADSVLHEHPPLRRKKIEHLITEYVHKRGIMRYLKDCDVNSNQSFYWLKQMRFYLNADEVDPQKKLTIRMANAQFHYGFEYLGIQEKLVQTPLTDRCFLTMTQALESRLGGSPFGPAGTGKTESVKALGNQLGRFVLVFNCDENFDFQAVGRIFIGLCQVGAWGCFDEFNRLEEHDASVELLGKRVWVSPQMAIFITMNPGYAGRSNLPDNLKQLFRSLAMTQPDKGLIAEVMLFSQGFRLAEKLSSKIVPFFTLCSEQLSNQTHYDFGLRALKYVLVKAGNVKRDHIQQLKEQFQQVDRSFSEGAIGEQLPEQEILIQSVCETLVPKLVAEDIPLMFSLLSDVFPGIPHTKAEMKRLREEIRKVCRERYLCYSEVEGELGYTWAEKVIQLYQIVQLNHGLMMVGSSGSGKTKAWQVLLAALGRVDGVDGAVHVIDPKAITKDALYGTLDPNTREWTDVFLIVFPFLCHRIIDNVRGESTKRQWIIFDGDVDPEWVENLNSVLDDNKLLTLPNGERLALPQNVRIMFEVENLKYATLATVSRCGMVWFSADCVTEEMCFENYLQKLRNVSLDAHEDSGVPVSSLSVTQAQTNLTDQISPSLQVQRDIANILAPYLSCGGLVARCLEFAENQVSIDGEWSSLHNRVPQVEVESHKVGAPDVVIPTIDTVLHEQLLYTWLADHKPLVLCGPPGSGKTMTLFSSLRSLPDMEVVGLNFSSATSPELLLKTFDHYCEYKRTPNGIVLSPVQLGKWIVLFCDEINLPNYDKYGTQRVISFLRQVVEHGGFYRSSDQAWVTVERIQFVVYVDYPGELSLKQIYGTFNRAMLRMIPSLRSFAEPLTAAMVEFYLLSQDKFTPELQPHYVYSPRELTRWVRGICEAIRPLETLNVENLVKLWAHEALRLFQDRLAEEDERRWTDEQIDLIAAKHFPNVDVSVVLRRPLLYSCWLTKDYLPVEREELRNFLQARLRVFYEEELDVRLVFFDEVLDHVLRIDRIFRQPQGEKLCFIMDESNLLDSSFLERINTLLANGEVPGLFEGDEYTTLMSQIKEASQHEGLILDSSEELYRWFTQQVMRNLHVVFTMNPSSEGLKDRVSTSPALFNRCVVNWFGDWSKSALFQVGRELTSNLDMDNTAYKPPDYFPYACDLVSRPPTYREAVVNAYVYVHETLHQVVLQLTKRDHRTVFITPRHFLDFINHYVKLFHEKRKDLVDQQRHLNIGLSKIVETEQQVTELQKSLSLKSKELEEKSALANEKLKQMLSNRQEAENQKHMSEQIQSNLQQQLAEVAAKKSDVMKQLAQVEPAVIDAQNAVKSIKKQHLVEVRSMANPPGLVKLALESICLLLGENCTDWKLMRAVIVKDDFISRIVNFDTDSVTPPATVKLALEAVIFLFTGSSTLDWKSIRGYLLRDDFVSQILNFDTERITEDIRQKMKTKYLDNPEYNYEKVNRASQACGPMVKWATAQINYAEMLHKVEPLRNELKKLENDAEVNKRKVEDVNAVINQLEKSIASYKDEYALLISEVQSIKADLIAVQTKNLGSERQRWEQSSDTFKTQMETIVGDVLLSAAFISYAGYFDQQIRLSLFMNWSRHLDEAGIQFRPDISLVEYLANPDERLRWQQHALPVDELCVENAIMLKRFTRYPLIIDPSGQAIEFLMQEYGERKIIRTSFMDDAFRKNLESALRFGNSLLVQDVECYDPILNPVLNYEVKRAGGRVLITVGDQDIDLSPSFQIFLSTRDPTIQLTPDICSRVTVINFTVTRSSLQSQCLNHILKAERPDIDSKRSDLMKLQGEFALRLRHLETSLLQALNDVKGRILDDDSIISTLETLKKEAAEVSRKASETETVMMEIEKTSQLYTPFSSYCASLYFTLDHLNQMHFLYQYSLQFFMDIFMHVLNKKSILDGISDYSQRLNVITKNIFKTVYRRVSLGLLHHDRLGFALLLSRIYLKGMSESDCSFDDEFSHLLMRSDSLKTADTAPFSTSGQLKLSKEQKEKLAQLVTLPAFASLAERLAQTEGVLEWIESSNPEINCPIWWDESKTKTPVSQALYRLLLIQAVRPDRLLSAAHMFIDIAFGENFMSTGENILNLKTIVETEISCNMPLLLCSVPGYDASGRVDDLSSELDRGLTSIAMGSAEGFDAAEKAVNSSAKTGRWVLLKNVHLATGWLIHLEKKLHSLVPHPNFRLFLTMEIHPKLPVNLLRAGRIIVYEPPPGIKANLLRTFGTIPPGKMTKPPAERPRLFFLLAWLHALVQERLQYVPLGWTKKYEFSEADLRAAWECVDTWVDAAAHGRANLPAEKVPWNAIRTLLSQCIYGGHLDNEFDQILLDCFIEKLFSEKSFQPDFALVNNVDSLGNKLTIPDGVRREQYVNWVESIQALQSPAWLGLPSNAEKVLLTIRGQTMVKKLLKMNDEDEELAYTPIGEQFEGDNHKPHWLKQIREAADHWLNSLPTSLAPLKRSVSNIKDPLYRFFEREVNIASRLLNNVRHDLADLIGIVDGNKKPTNHHRDLFAHLNKGLVPETWIKYTIPSATTITQWVHDFAERLAQFQLIVDAVSSGRIKNLKNRLWIGGLLSPEAYLTATRQHVAQLNEWSLEELKLDVQVSNTFDNLQMDDCSFGVTGLKIMGVSCSEQGRLKISPKIWTDLLAVQLKWVHGIAEKQKLNNTVRLPVYLYTDRQRVLFSLDFQMDPAILSNDVVQKSSKFNVVHCMMDVNLVALITGGASGLGKGCAEQLLKMGSKIVLMDLPTSSGAEVAESLHKTDVVFSPGDVASESDVSKTLEFCRQKFGKLDAVVNCAAIGIAFTIYNNTKKKPHPLEPFENVFRVNVLGTFNVIRQSIGMMLEKELAEDEERGVIIITSSTAAFDGQQGQAAYAACCGALNSMTLPLARDCSRHRIRVVTIAPGLFNTPLTSFLPEKVRQFFGRLTPYPHRFGEPVEFGHLVKSVIENPMINGEVIRIDGDLSGFFHTSWPVNLRALDNGVALTPPMGWLSWAAFGCQTDCSRYPLSCINEALYMDMADRLVEDGYLEAGYNLVNIDDCWSEMKRDSNDQLVADRTRFPSGIKQLARYVRTQVDSNMHDRNLKLGIYGDFGTETCARYPGSLYFLKLDAQTFASWDVDMLKLDGCNVDVSLMPAVALVEISVVTGYSEMSRYLNETGRRIIYSCSWPAYEVSLRIKPDYLSVAQSCNMWRNYNDISLSWHSILKIIDFYDKNEDDLAAASGPGRWNDPDMLIIGYPGLSIDQARAQMAVWCIWSAPLLMSNDLRFISPYYREILLNKKAIAVDQDPLGIMGRLIYKSGYVSVYKKPITPVSKTNQHSYAFVFLNRHPTDRAVVTVEKLELIGLQNPFGYQVEDVFDNFSYGHLMPSAGFQCDVRPTSAVMLTAIIAQN